MNILLDSVVKQVQKHTRLEGIDQDKKSTNRIKSRTCSARCNYLNNDLNYIRRPYQEFLVNIFNRKYKLQQIMVPQVIQTDLMSNLTSSGEKAFLIKLAIFGLSELVDDCEVKSFLLPFAFLLVSKKSIKMDV